MRLALYVLTVSGGTLLQSTVAPSLPIGGIVPDVPLILVVLLALRRSPESGCVSGALLGLAQDVLAGGPLGLHAVSKACLGFLAGGLPRVLLVDQPIVPVGAVLVASLIDGTLRFALLQLFHYPAPFGELLGGVIVPQALYNTAITMVVVAVPAVRARV